jgi:hypothetical protein
LETDNDKSRVVWGNIVRHVGDDNLTWVNLMDIATGAALVASDPLEHAFKFAILAECAPTAQFVDMIYTNARNCGAMTPDIEEIVERRLTREFSRTT